MTYEITNYTKFGIKVYDMEGESDSAIVAFFLGRVDHHYYNQRFTIRNKQTEKLFQVQNFLIYE